MSEQQSQLIKDALSTGIFVERTEPTKGRKYYINRRTKESFWQLTKEIVDKAKASLGGAGGGAAQSSAAEEKRAVVRDERLEQTRKRAEIEAQLRASVSALERQKHELESELVGIEGPVETELEELEILRRELADSRNSLISVEKDVVQQRKRRHGELQDILTKVAAMQSLAESERRHREAVEERHNSLVEEGYELRANIQKERSALEGLKDSLEMSEKRILEAESKLERQRELIANKQEEIRGAEEELRTLCETRSKVDDDVRRLREEIDHMSKQLVSRQSFAQKSLQQQQQQQKSEDQDASQKLLFHLVSECESKKRTLAKLSRSEERREDTSRIAEQNMHLARLATGFEEDRAKLESLDRFLTNQLTQANAWLLDAKAEGLALAEEISLLEASEAKERERAQKGYDNRRGNERKAAFGSPRRGGSSSPSRVQFL